MENIERLRKKLDIPEENMPEPRKHIHPILWRGSADRKKRWTKQKGGLMTRGIQTMFRLTSDNHLELSGMADGKANILISVNAIIISVILTVLLRRLEIDTHLTIPTIIFLVIFTNHHRNCHSRYKATDHAREFLAGKIF